MDQEFSFHSQESGTTLNARLVVPEGSAAPHRIVMMVTGDSPKGTKSASWSNLPPLLAAAGVASFLFDFEGLGYSGGQRRTLTLSKGIDNLRSATNFLRQQPWADPTRLGVLASSFGASALLTQPEVANGFRAIGLKSPASFLADAYIGEVGVEKFDKWATQGYLEENGYVFDVLIDALQYNIYSSARGIRTPSLITHGSADTIVPPVQSKYLTRCLGGPVQLQVLEGVGHGYSEEGAWEQMASLFVDWFVKHLRTGT